MLGRAGKVAVALTCGKAHTAPGCKKFSLLLRSYPNYGFTRNPKPSLKHYALNVGVNFLLRLDGLKDRSLRNRLKINQSTCLTELHNPHNFHELSRMTGDSIAHCTLSNQRNLLLSEQRAACSALRQVIFNLFLNGFRGARQTQNGHFLRCPSCVAWMGQAGLEPATR